MKKLIFPVILSVMVLSVQAQKKSLTNTQLNDEPPTSTSPKGKEQLLNIKHVPTPRSGTKGVIINDIQNKVQSLSSINGVIRLGDDCLKNGIKYKSGLSSADKAKYGSFTVYEAIKNAAGVYLPGKTLSSVSTFGEPNGATMPFTISKFGQVQRVIIVFKAQDRFFESGILSYTFNSKNVEVTSNLLMTAKPFTVMVNCENNMSEKK